MAKLLSPDDLRLPSVTAARAAYTHGVQRGTAKVLIDPAKLAAFQQLVPKVQTGEIRGPVAALSYSAGVRLYVYEGQSEIPELYEGSIADFGEVHWLASRLSDLNGPPVVVDEAWVRAATQAREWPEVPASVERLAELLGTAAQVSKSPIALPPTYREPIAPPPAVAFKPGQAIVSNVLVRGQVVPEPSDWESLLTTLHNGGTWNGHTLAPARTITVGRGPADRLSATATTPAHQALRRETHRLAAPIDSAAAQAWVTEFVRVWPTVAAVVVTPEAEAVGLDLDRLALECDVAIVRGA